jgi:DUF3102 family protein
MDTMLSTETILEQHADAIKTLGKRVVGDVIEIGRHLTEAKQICGHGRWLPWLERNFGWTDRTARNFMQVYEGFGAKSETISDLNLSISCLYELAKPSTPVEVRQEVIGRVERGELVSRHDVKKLVAEVSALPRDSAADPIVETCEDSDTEQECWQRSLANMASDAVALEASWSREFGNGWRKFTAPSDIRTLACQAADAWVRIVHQVHVGAEPDLISAALHLLAQMTDEQRERFVKEACIHELARKANITSDSANNLLNDVDDNDMPRFLKRVAAE